MVGRWPCLQEGLRPSAPGEPCVTVSALSGARRAVTTFSIWPATASSDVAVARVREQDRATWSDGRRDARCFSRPGPARPALLRLHQVARSALATTWGLCDATANRWSWSSAHLDGRSARTSYQVRPAPPRRATPPTASAPRRPTTIPPRFRPGARALRPLDTTDVAAQSSPRATSSTLCATLTLATSVTYRPKPDSTHWRPRRPRFPVAQRTATPPVASSRCGASAQRSPGERTPLRSKGARDRRHARQRYRRPKRRCRRPPRCARGVRHCCDPSGAPPRREYGGEGPTAPVRLYVGSNDHASISGDVHSRHQHGTSVIPALRPRSGNAACVHRSTEDDRDQVVGSIPFGAHSR